MEELILFFKRSHSSDRKFPVEEKEIYFLMHWVISSEGASLFSLLREWGSCRLSVARWDWYWRTWFPHCWVVLCFLREGLFWEECDRLLFLPRFISDRQIIYVEVTSLLTQELFPGLWLESACDSGKWDWPIECCFEFAIKACRFEISLYGTLRSRAKFRLIGFRNSTSGNAMLEFEEAFFLALKSIQKLKIYLQKSLSIFRLLSKFFLF